MIMNITTQHDLTDQQLRAVYNLWNEEYPQRLKYDSIADLVDYLNKLNEITHVLLTDSNGVVAGWAAKFLRDGERWFAIILKSDIQGKGFGRKMLDELKQQESELVGWLIDKEDEICDDGRKYRSPMQFYIKNGFTLLPAQRIETEKLSAVKMRWKA